MNLIINQQQNSSIAKDIKEANNSTKLLVLGEMGNGYKSNLKALNFRRTKEKKIKISDTTPKKMNPVISNNISCLITLKEGAHGTPCSVFSKATC